MRRQLLSANARRHGPYDPAKSPVTADPSSTEAVARNVTHVPSCDMLTLPRLLFAASGASTPLSQSTKAPFIKAPLSQSRAARAGPLAPGGRGPGGRVHRA
eukprot:1751815-Rhodomonas_salina.6